ncbi:MAG: hypothetical protein HKN47_18485, partial [Pirellulaceae bacterium]|nr:hypothetical protein [Pirellulaceae bacterium]
MHAVSFVDESTGVAVGDRGTILRTIDGGRSWQIVASDTACRLDDVLWINATQVVAVGGAYDRITSISRGVVLWSQDAGQHWQRGDDVELPRLRELRFRQEDRAVVAIGDWASSSLSREFESRDGGKSWNNSGELDGPVRVPRQRTSVDYEKWTRVTGIAAPIRDACRVGDSGLCAVGDHGVILRSPDRGQTWHVARGDDRSTAVLLIAATPGRIAWPLVGSESLEMRHRLSVLLNQAPTQDAGGTNSDPSVPSSLDLAQQAAVMLGAAGVDYLGDRPSESFQRWLTIHRPSVVVVDKSLPAALRSSMMQMAVSSGVQRVVEFTFNVRGESMLHNGAMLPSTGVLASDLWQDALQIVTPNRRMEKSVSLRRVYDAAGVSKRGESVMSGLPSVRGQDLSATKQPASRRHLQVVQARVSQPQHVTRLIKESRSREDFIAAFGRLLDQTAKGDRFRLAWHVFQEIEDDPDCRIGFSHATLSLIADRFGDTSAGKWAALRADAMQNSTEWSQLQSISRDDLAQADDASVSSPDIAPVSPFQLAPGRVAQVAATTPLLVPKPERLQQRNTTQRETHIDLAWEFHPYVLVAREAARHRGDENDLEPTTVGAANLRRLAEDRSAAAWARLINGNGGGAVIANAAATSPRLDGHLDDPCWTGALRSAGDDSALRISYDEDYVYVALQVDAGQLPADDFVRVDSSPVRDHPLQDIDHIELSIDLDTDLTTAMQFSMTDAGRTHDAVDGRAAWNPTWYIAHHRNDEHVQFELAIERRD